MHVNGISGNFSKAFYCVNYELLLSKPHFYGIQNIGGLWLTLYLHDKRQQVETKSSQTNTSTYSNWVITKHEILYYQQKLLS